MPFVSVFVFRQKMREPEIQRVMNDIPLVFGRLSQARGVEFDEGNVSVALVDGAARNVFSPESHAKGFQGLDILMLVFAKIANEEDSEELRESLESQFRDKWVTRARIFSPDETRWKVPSWDGEASVTWGPRSE